MLVSLGTQKHTLVGNDTLERKHGCKGSHDSNNNTCLIKKQAVLPEAIKEK